MITARRAALRLRAGLPDERRAADQPAPVERREAYAADITYGTNNEFGFDYLRDNMVIELDQRVQREQLLRDRRRGRQHPHRRGADAADHQRPGRGVGRQVLHVRPARAAPQRRDPRATRRAATTSSTSRTRPSARPSRASTRWRSWLGVAEPVRRRPGPGPPLRAGPPRPRPVQARPRLHRQGRRDHHRRRVHRPPDAGPALERGPPPGDRGEGGPARPARERDPRHDHVPELLPPVRQAGRHDRHGDDRGRGVPQDLQARGRGRSRPTGR